MCTAISFLTNDHYFGRNLDLEYSYKETVTITPRNYPFHFCKMPSLTNHYALIGMAYVQENYPLYYEATNEKGLSMAGLNFPENANYKPFHPGKNNVTPFEFIPWILGQCVSVQEAKRLLDNLSLLNEDFSPELPLSPLHWMISDRTSSIAVESVKNSLHVYDNPVNVLTNDPTFDRQLDYLNCTELLPGNWTSRSRFVRAVHVLKHSACGDSEQESISQFFHILNSVEQPKGCICVPDGRYKFTIYSCCCNTDKGIYYYKTYDNSQITAVNMHKENLDDTQLTSYTLIKEQKILHQQNDSKTPV